MQTYTNLQKTVNDTGWLVDKLKLLPAWNTLNEQQIRDLAAIGQLNCFAKNDHIFIEGDAIGHFFFLLEGIVKFYKHTAEGKTVTIAVLHAVESFGEMTLFDDGPVSASALAKVESKLLLVPKKSLIQFIGGHPEILIRLYAQVVLRLKTGQETLLNNVACKVDERLLRTLMSLELKFGSELPFTHQDIADIIGTTRETASRKIEQLQFQNILSTQKGKITILDRAKLQENAGS